jgi:DHA1 family tetracycline resistance protein-like MFS transporter
VYFILSATGEAYGTCWALWGFDTFQWNGLWIGLSLGTFGVCQTLVQALLPGPATKLLGERKAVLVGIACACVALVAMSFANQGWIVFAIMPVFALGGLGTPAFQALATRQVDPGHQGQLQGVLTSAVSLASIVGPLTFSSFYFIVRKEWPGSIWLSVVAIHAIAVPLVLLVTRTARPPQSEIDTMPSALAHAGQKTERRGS